MLDLILIIINYFDFIMFYCMGHKLIDKNLEISVGNIILSGVYGIVIGVLANVLDAYTYKIIVTVVILCILKFISKRKMHDVLIVYVIIFLCISLIQIMVLFCVSSLPINGSYLLLCVQTLVLLNIIIVYLKVPLHKILNVIEKELVLQLFFFIMTFVFLLLSSYFNFNHKNIQPYIIYFSILIIITIFGLYHTVRYVLFYTNKVPMQLHDVKNVLMGIYISVHNASDIDTIKTEIDKSLEIMRMDISLDNMRVNTYQDSMVSFVNEKKKKASKDLDIVTDISCYESHSKVPLSNVLYMLGVLLDNAIESGTRKPITVKVYIDSMDLVISVANEYERKGMHDFEKMVQKKYSTKENDCSRGYGLSNLSKAVGDYGGDVLLKYNYKEEQSCNYLTMTIEIKK